MRNNNILDFPANRARPTSRDAVKAELLFDAGYKLPDRLPMAESRSGVEANSDLQSIRKQTIGRLMQVLARPGTRPRLVAALTRAAPQGGAVGANQLIDMILQGATQFGQSTLADRFPAFVLAQSIAPPEITTTPAANALPRPVSAAFVRGHDAPNKVLFSRNLGFRDMQLQSQVAAAMVVLEDAKAKGVAVGPTDALDDLSAILLGDPSSLASPQTGRLPNTRTIKVRFEQRLFEVPPERYRIDPTL